MVFLLFSYLRLKLLLGLEFSFSWSGRYCCGFLLLPFILWNGARLAYTGFVQDGGSGCKTENEHNERGLGWNGER